MHNSGCGFVPNVPGGQIAAVVVSIVLVESMVSVVDDARVDVSVVALSAVVEVASEVKSVTTVLSSTVVDPVGSLSVTDGSVIVVTSSGSEVVTVASLETVDGKSVVSIVVPLSVMVKDVVVDSVSDID